MSEVLAQLEKIAKEKGSLFPSVFCFGSNAPEVLYVNGTFKCQGINETCVVGGYTLSRDGVGNIKLYSPESFLMDKYDKNGNFVTTVNVLANTTNNLGYADNPNQYLWVRQDD